MNAVWQLRKIALRKKMLLNLQFCLLFPKHHCFFAGSLRRPLFNVNVRVRFRNKALEFFYATICIERKIKLKDIHSNNPLKGTAF